MVADLWDHVHFLNEFTQPVICITYRLHERACDSILILTRREAGEH